MVQEVATNNELEKVAKRWNATEWLKEDLCQGGQAPRMTLASMVEAMIGAVWIDCNQSLPKVRQVNIPHYVARTTL
jgi:ribonuclease-3